MLHPARRPTASKNLSRLCGQCQICGQITHLIEGGSRVSYLCLESMEEDIIQVKSNNQGIFCIFALPLLPLSK